MRGPYLSRLVSTLVCFATACMTALFISSESTARDDVLVNKQSQRLSGIAAMAGEVTDQSVLVQVRVIENQSVDNGQTIGAGGVVEFALTSVEKTGRTVVKTVVADSDRDFIARTHFGNLTANTDYQCTIRIGSSEQALQDGPRLIFKTHPGPSISAPVSFAVVTGMNYGKFHGEPPAEKVQRSAKESKANRARAYEGSDKYLGYPALASIVKMKPDFFVGTGDNVYYDRPAHRRAKSTAEMRHKWQQQFAQPRFQDLFATVPTVWMIDDHDYRIDDADNEGDYRPRPEVAKAIAFEQLPFAPSSATDPKTYRTRRVSKDLQVWFTENRFFRSPNKMPDGPGKSIWGEQQKQWLQNSLLASDATCKLLISPTPMVGPDDLRKKDNHCDVGGFRHERDEFFNFLKTNGLDKQKFYIVCGDRHWQYHAIDPSGFEEFSCGALVDANSRLGRLPGDANGTDSEGLIKHLHQQTEASGGFLMIRCEPGQGDNQATLSFDFYDENGQLLYACKK